MLLRLAGHRYGCPRAREDDPISGDRLARVERQLPLLIVDVEADDLARTISASAFSATSRK
jgi:hypothetical protein